MKGQMSEIKMKMQFQSVSKYCAHSERDEKSGYLPHLEVEWSLKDGLCQIQ